VTSRRDLAHRKNSLAPGEFGVEQRFQEAYRQGRTVRRAGAEVTQCVSLDPVLLGWMRAGWHDVDMEKGKRLYFGSRNDT
jgi:hypothetical protein